MAQSFHKLTGPQRHLILFLKKYVQSYVPLSFTREYLDEHPKAWVHKLLQHPITLAILIGMGICYQVIQNCNKNIVFTCVIFCRSSWSTSWPYPYQNDNFCNIMSSCCFELLLNFLHPNDAREQPAQRDPGCDKLYKVHRLMQLCRTFSPAENLSTDESMIAFKRKASLLQRNHRSGG